MPTTARSATRTFFEDMQSCPRTRERPFLRQNAKPTAFTLTQAAHAS
jgi:hypothetical protein